MKKIIFLIIALIVLTTAVQAERKWYKATAISLKWSDEERYGDWQNLIPTIQVFADWDKHHVIVYTDKTQIFDYDNFIHHEDSEVETWRANATDTNYKRCTLKVMFHKENKKSALILIYDDLSYMYLIE